MQSQKRLHARTRTKGLHFGAPEPVFVGPFLQYITAFRGYVPSKTFDTAGWFFFFLLSFEQCSTRLFRSRRCSQVAPLVRGIV